MRIAEVIGTVTLARGHPSLPRGRWLIAVPFSLAALRALGPPDGEDVVVFDELGAGPGSWIGISEGREAAMPFHPEKKPLDAYCACIVDQLDVSGS
jgi:ethanolamine utilization protein EutN